MNLNACTALHRPVAREARHAGPAAVLGLCEAALHQLQPHLVVAVERQQDAVGRAGLVAAADGHHLHAVQHERHAAMQYKRV